MGRRIAGVSGGVQHTHYTDRCRGGDQGSESRWNNFGALIAIAPSEYTQMCYKVFYHHIRNASFYRQDISN